MKKLTKLAALAAATALALSACGSDDGGSGDTDSTEGTSVETMFGTIEIPAPEDGTLDVIALGWSDAEMALALGVKPIAVFDWQGFGEDDHGVGPWAADEFGDDAPTVIPSSQQTLNYEQLQSLNPDVILNVRAANTQEDYDRLAEIAPTVYAPEGTEAFATDWETQLTTIGEALGKTDEAEQVIAETKAAIEAAGDDAFDGVEIASAAKFGDAYGAYLPGDGRFDILADLGFVNASAVDSLESNGFFATVPAERVEALDAEVAVFLPIGFSLADTEADPLIASLNVAKDGRAIFLDPDSDLAGAWSASSVLSIPFVLDELVPQLKAAVDQLG